MFSQTIVILLITVGIPVICLTKIIMTKMQQNFERQTGGDSKTYKVIDSLVNTVSRLQKRVENLETVIQNRYE